MASKCWCCTVFDGFLVESYGACGGLFGCWLSFIRVGKFFSHSWFISYEKGIMLHMPHTLGKIMYENHLAQRLARSVRHDSYHRLVPCAREEPQRERNTCTLGAEIWVSKRPHATGRQQEQMSSKFQIPAWQLGIYRFIGMELEVARRRTRGGHFTPGAEGWKETGMEVVAMGGGLI